MQRVHLVSSSFSSLVVHKLQFVSGHDGFFPLLILLPLIRLRYSHLLRPTFLVLVLFRHPLVLRRSLSNVRQIIYIRRICPRANLSLFCQRRCEFGDFIVILFPFRDLTGAGEFGFFLQALRREGTKEIVSV